ncbi:MAG: pyruvate kinase [Burkholderiales bacterium]|nr:pyruvate kinase [Burkholderiales bacterium]
MKDDTPLWAPDTPGAWDADAGGALIRDLWTLRAAMIEREAQLEPQLREVDPAHRPSAVNLVHYLAMRQIDLRQLQDRLAWVGVSSLGRAETHVLANVDKVLGILHRIAGRAWSPLSRDEPAGFMRGTTLLQHNAQALFGPMPDKRRVRMMVTLPSEAASDEGLVASLVANGMDVARINCAHDGPQQWAAMAASVRRAAARAQRSVRVLMDVAGPKLRTGPIDGGAQVVKIKPQRDVFGHTVAASRFGLRAMASTLPVPGAAVALGVDAAWLANVRLHDRIDLADARGARRRLVVVECTDQGLLVECERTLYLTPDCTLRLHRASATVRETGLGQIPEVPGHLHLSRGDRLDLVPQGLGHGALPGGRGRKPRNATLSCTLPEVLPQIRTGQRIWFDDGHIGGVVRRCSAGKVQVEITDARDGGDKLAADKGINLPDTALDLPALTTQDLQDLATVAQHADIVGLSFAQSAADVQALRQRLVELGAPHLGLILKVETRRGFEHLPEMLLAAMAGSAAGVMIARGDLAVECGYERMAEVQEEILWACEAAHMPVVWATQVLETLAKTGRPSRAEITDAAMGGRAECVMLNKGPHILDAMRTLDDILQRMQSHQSKKRPLLRALKAWNLGAADPAVQAGRRRRPMPRKAATKAR